jgi:hypothetical protein
MLVDNNTYIQEVVVAGRPLSKRKSWVMTDILVKAKVYDVQASVSQGGTELRPNRGFAASQAT